MKLNSIPLILIALATIPFLTNNINSTKNINIKDYSNPEIKSFDSNLIIKAAMVQNVTYSDFQKFIVEANLRINQNEINILKMKNKFTSDECESTKINLNMFDTMSKSNEAFKLKLDDYTKNGSGNWKIFKTDLYTELNAFDEFYNQTTDKHI